MCNGSDKTLKRSKKKKFDQGTAKYEIHKYAKTTLGILDLQQAVQLPENALLNDWLAVHGDSPPVNPLSPAPRAYCVRVQCKTFTIKS